MPTEQDLRAAFTALADTVDPHYPAAADVPPPGAHRPPRPGAGRLIAVAACVLAIVAISVALALRPTRHGSPPLARPSGAVATTIRITVRGGCPAALEGAFDVRNPSGELSQRFAPANAVPTAGLVCQYGSLNPPRERSIPLTRAAAEQIASAASKIVPAPAPNPTDGTEVTNCPADLGFHDVIVLSYPAGDVDLWFEPGGCQQVDNGFVEAGIIDSSAGFDNFETVFDRLVPLPPPGR